MNDPLDQFWNSVLAAEAPGVDEMARAEASLRAVGPAPSLPQERIDAMVRAAVRATETGLPAPRRSGYRHVVAIAAVLFLSLSVAWFGYSKLRWSEATHAVRTLDYAEAIAVATAPNQPEEDWVAALGVIDNHCGYAFPAIREVCAANVAPPLRDQARQVRDQLVTLLTRGSDRQPETVDLGLVHATEAVRNTALTIEERQRALAHLGHLCIQGMRAFAATRLRTTKGSEQQRIWREKLLRDLAP